MATANDPRDILDKWHSKAWFRRQFLPDDFMSVVKPESVEDFKCIKHTIHHLEKLEAQSAKTLKLAEAGKYSQDPNYLPSRFKNEKRQFIIRQTRIECSSCRGYGRLACSTTENCSRCKGWGTKEETCMTCAGRGYLLDAEGRGGEDCFDCHNGSISQRCSRCAGSGDVTCAVCRGRGYVGCRNCDASGQLVNAQIVTQQFTHKVEVDYQIPGRGFNEFIHGLHAGDFEDICGEKLYDARAESPTNRETVRQERSCESYEVRSATVNYCEKTIFFNLIQGQSEKIVYSSLPWSKRRLAMGLGIGFGVLMLAAFTAYLGTLL